MHQPEEHRRRDHKEDESEVVELKVASCGDAEKVGPRHADQPVISAGEPFLVPQHKKDDHVKGQCYEGKEMVLHAQRRIAEQETDHEGYPHGREPAQDPMIARKGDQRGYIGPDPHETRLGEADLSGVAQREVEPHRSDRKHQP